MASAAKYMFIGVVFAVLLAILFVGGVSDPSSTEESVYIEPTPEPEVVEVKPVEVKTIVSDKFPPGYNNPDITELQKEAYFDTRLKGEYVQWTGILSDVTMNGRNTVKISVDHGSSMNTNALIRLVDGQIEKAITLKRGDTVTYTAKMTRWGSFLGFYGEDGVIL